MIKKLKSTVSRLLPKNQFARGISVLVGGTAGSQLVMLLASPLLTRLFSPEEFGLLAVYTSFLALFTVVTSLRYELAIPLPTDEKEAVNVVILSLLIVVAISLISALMVIFSGAALATLFGVSTLSDYLWFLPIGVFFVGTYQVFNFWAIRQKNFGGISKTRIKQAITTLIIQLIGYKLGVAALIGGHAGGQGVGSLALAGNSFKRNFFYQVSLSGIVTAAQRYRKFPLYSTWAGLFNTLGGQLPLLMFAALFSPVAAGLYALAQRVLALPMSVIGSAIGNVFLANAAEAHREKRLAPLVARMHEKLAHIAMPPALILMISAPELFALTFGEQWRESGNFAQWMAPWIYLVFVASPLSTLFEVMEKQKQHLLFQAVLLIVRIVTILGGAIYHDLELAIAGFSIGSAACWIWLLCWINRIAGNGLSNILWPSISALTWAFFCVLPLLIGINYFSDNYTWLIFLALSATLVCLRYLSFLKKDFQ